LPLKPDVCFLSAFFAHTDEEHRRLSEYANLKTAKTRDDFVKKHVTRWTELLHLPYFDTVCMIIIDPMHNLLLGKFMVKFAP